VSPSGLVTHALKLLPALTCAEGEGDPRELSTLMKQVPTATVKVAVIVWSDVTPEKR